MAKRPSPWGWNPAGRRRYAVLALWLGHGLWVVYGRGPGSAWTRLGDAVAMPLQRTAGGWQAWRRRRAEVATDLASANAELDRLRRENQSLRAAAEREAPQLAEAEELARLMGLKRQIPLETKAARVLFSPVGAAFAGPILDAGLDAGIQPDEGVLAPEGVVGRIWSVGPTQSKVLPVDAPNASLGVMLARSRATGVLQGLGNGFAEIRYLNNQEVVQVNEAVYTSGLDRVFPRGLLVGYVTEVKQGDLELEVRVQLAAPLRRMHAVLVLPAQPPLEVQAPLAPGAKGDAP
ncbi:MAG TPA: rod shape-determining protein MreC [Holophagaceae bacterium]|nr:rod shape-determining protein MreC [Holophagaceae bacterium]